jgi:hypothetical protein
MLVPCLHACTCPFPLLMSASCWFHAYMQQRLMLACKKGHLDVVKMLYRHMERQGLDEKVSDGRTALIWAAYGGHEDVLRFLLLAGADPTVTDNEGRTPRAIAEEEVGEAYPQADHLPERRARCVAVFQVRSRAGPA